MAIRNDGGSEESEEDDDDDVVGGVGDDFRKHIDALKRACVLEVGNGGYIATPASILSRVTPPATGFGENDDEGEEDEDDDELFLSIKSKYGAFGSGEDSALWLAKKTGTAKKKSEGAEEEQHEEEGHDDEEEEEDDEEILRSVEKLYKSGVGWGDRDCGVGNGGSRAGGRGGQRRSVLPSLRSAPEDVSPQSEKPDDVQEGGLRVQSEKNSHPSPSQHASPGCEPGGDVVGEDGGFSPQTRFETETEQPEEVERSVGVSPRSRSETGNEQGEEVERSIVVSSLTRSETGIEQGEEVERSIVVSSLTRSETGVDQGEEVERSIVVSSLTRSEAGSEQGDQVGRSIPSFLPGSWIETDGDLQYCDASPARSHGGNNPSATSEETDNHNTPESARVLTDALKKNRQCQKTLRNVLSQVEAKQKENAELLKRVRSLVDFEKYCDRRFAGFFTDPANPSVKLISAKAPASQNKSSDSILKTASDVQTCGPPENPDVEIYRKLQKKVAFTFPCRRWSNDESIELAKGVKQQVYGVIVQQAMDTLSNADALDEEFNDLDDYVSKIGGKEFSPQQIRDAVPGIDWEEVARVYVIGRTPEECRTRWINHEDSLINKGPWKKMEDKKLLSIAQQHDFCTWENLAEQLGTNRTPAECLTRYQRSLNASIMRSNWTPDEDKRLRAAVEEWGENDWSAVAACLEGRNNSQCLMRWYKVLHPTKKKKGRWSVEEDKRLKWAVSVYGPKKWKQITEHVPGRTDLQCRERWCNVLDPSIKLGEWTEDEDKILEESVARHGPHRWAAVANDLKIRTDNQCCRRWKFLHPEDQPEFQRTVHIRRTALVGNFQGRKKERPRLGPQDFISKDIPKKRARVKQKQQWAMPMPMPVPIPINTGNAARERRAARILVRKAARAKNSSNDGGAGEIVSVPNVETNGELLNCIDPVNLISERRPSSSLNVEGNTVHVGSSKNTKRKGLPGPDPLDDGNSRSRKRTKRGPSEVADARTDLSEVADKGRKRKAGHIADRTEPPSRRSKLGVSRKNASTLASPFQDTSREVQSAASFLDLVQSLGRYCCLLAEERIRVGRCTDATTTTQEPAENTADVGVQSLPVSGFETHESVPEKALSRERFHEESDTGPRLDVYDGDSGGQRGGMNMPEQGNGHFVDEDKEVASATRAILSWPFLRGVQELLSPGTTSVRALGAACVGSKGSQGTATDLSPQRRTYVGPLSSSQSAEQVGTEEEGVRGSVSPRPVPKSRRISLKSEGRRRGSGSLEAVTEFSSQRATSQGVHESSSRNAVEIGANVGDSGSLPLALAEQGGTEEEGGRDSVSSRPVPKPRRIFLNSQGRRRAVGSLEAVTQFSSQRATSLGVHQSSSRNAAENGTNIRDSGSLPPAQVDQVGTEEEGGRGSVSSRPVPKSRRISLKSQGRRRAVGSLEAVTEFSSQRATSVGVNVSSSRDAAEDGTNIGDRGSLPPPLAVKKPRSKRPARMRGALILKTTEEVAALSRIYSPECPVGQSDQNDNS